MELSDVGQTGKTNVVPGDVVYVYAAVSNSDLNSGKGADVVVGYFWGHDEAYRFGRGRSVQGSDCKVVERQGVVDLEGRVWVDGLRDVAVGGSLDRALARDAARAKLEKAGLTANEFELLGIAPHSRPRGPA